MSHAELKHNFDQKFKSGQLRIIGGNGTGKTKAAQQLEAAKAEVKSCGASAGFNRRGNSSRGSSVRNIPGNLKVVGQNNSPKNSPKTQYDPNALKMGAFTDAANVWAYSSVNAELKTADEVRSEKQRNVREFIEYCFLTLPDRDISQIKALDITNWLKWMKEFRNLSTTFIYTKCSHLSAFYDWLGKHETLGRFFPDNPARAAMPKAPKPYRSKKTKSLDDHQLEKLFCVMQRAGRSKGIIGLRDYAMFLFFTATGDRRSEIVDLKGSDIELQPNGLIYYATKKGGERFGKRLDESEIVRALNAYLKASGRKPKDVFSNDVPIWLAHDNAKICRDNEKCAAGGKVDPTIAALVENGTLKKSALVKASRTEIAGMTSHAFAARMKRYARQAGIEEFHLHMIRHTFARIVGETTESMNEAREALDHKNVSTTRNYVNNLIIKKATFSSLLKSRAASR